MDSFYKVVSPELIESLGVIGWSFVALIVLFGSIVIFLIFYITYKQEKAINKLSETLIEIGKMINSNTIRIVESLHTFANKQIKIEENLKQLKIDVQEIKGNVSFCPQRVENQTNNL